MQRLRDWAVGKSGRFVLPFLTVGVFGLLLRANYPPHWGLHDTVHMLADALAVGAVIALTLEFFASRILIDDAARELSERLVGEGLPHPLQAAISEIVHQTTIVLDEVKVHYRFVAVPGDNKHVDVIITRSYRATNYGRAVFHYSPLLAEEHLHNPIFLSLRCDPDQAGTPYSLTADVLKERVTTKTGSQVKTVKGNEVALMPFRDDERRSRCRCEWTYRLRTPATYSDVISFAKPALDCTITLDGDLPSGFRFDAANDPHWTIHSHNQWIYRRAFLAKAHLRVWWFSSDN